MGRQCYRRADSTCRAAEEDSGDTVGCSAFDNNPIDDSWEWSPSQSARPYSVYPAFKDGKLVGAAVEAYSLNGFSGEVRVMYGFGASGDVTGYEVLSHAETPGLGARMNEWFRSDEGNRSVIGHNPAVRT